MENGISVIIPVYNAQAYLERCIKSVISQGNCVFEVICVDDGSMDSSLEIIKRMQKSDSRINLIETSHQGASAARNEGKRVAQGEYILFVDADDYLLPGTLKRQHKTAKKCNADVLIFGGRAEDVWHAPEWVQRATNVRSRKYNSLYNKPWFKERGAFPVIWNKLFKTEVIREIEFPVHLKVAEDNVFLFWAFLEAERVIFRPERCYVYCINSNSTLTNIQGEDRKEQHRQAIQTVEQQLCEKGTLNKYWEEFCFWKSKIDGSMDNIKRNKAKVVIHYIEEYGVRSAIEHTIGKYIIKN